jgi:hypothetical protein
MLILGGTAGIATASEAVPRWSAYGGDAWDWIETVRGTAPCPEVRIENGGSPVTVVPTRRGRFTAEVRLYPGINRLTARCGEGGGRSEALVFHERLSPDPVARIEVSTDGRTVSLDAGRSEPSRFDGAAITRYLWSPRPGNPAPLHLSSVDDPVVSVRAPASAGEYYVTLTVTDAVGRKDRSTTYFVVRHGRTHAVDMATTNPQWVNRAVVYGVVPPLFGDHGFRSVIKKLPYLKRLGVTALWMSPINSTLPGDFGYRVTNYFGIRSDYGTKAEFRELVRRAHGLGMRVLMDFVANHLSDHSAYFRDTKKRGKASHYWDFFDRKPDGTPTHYFDWTYLPNLNYGNPEVRHLIISACSYWVRRFDIDGFRMDAAWGVHRRAPGFWMHWRMALKRIKPDLLLLAEAPAYDPYYFHRGFDAAYDWHDIGGWAWQPVFNSSSLIPLYLKDALTYGGRGIPPGGLVFRFLNNNDTGVRFATNYGVQTTHVAAAMEFTLPGLPLVYGGDEIGAAYDPYFDLHPLEWNDDPAHLRPYYERLIRIRDRWASLRSRHLELLDASPGDRVFAYLRTRPGSRPVLVILNYGRRARATLRRTGSLGRLREATSFTDVLSGDRVHVSGKQLVIPMAPYSARILVESG